MTDRYHSFIVILVKDMREDDAEVTIAAIQQIKGVLRVKPLVSDVEADVGYERARMDLMQKLFDVLREKG